MGVLKISSALPVSDAELSQVLIVAPPQYVKPEGGVYVAELGTSN